MEKKKECMDCKYFIQHYVKLQKNYRMVASGHCIFPRMKLRDGETPACKNFDLSK